MKTIKKLSPLPAAAPIRRRARKSKERLKPESSWATQIRGIFNFNQVPLRYLPFMPVPGKSGLLRTMRMIGTLASSRRGGISSASISLPRRTMAPGQQASVVRQADWVLFNFFRPRFTFSRISLAEAVQTKGFGLALWAAR